MLKDAIVRFEAKLDAIREELARIREIQAQHHMSLDEHMRRTEAAEEAISDFRGEIAPIRSHILAVELVARTAGFLSAGVAILTGVLKVLGKL